MGIGPVPAIKAALNKADKSLQNMELIEVILLRGTVNYWIFYVFLVILSLVWHKLLFKSLILLHSDSKGSSCADKVIP